MENADPSPGGQITQKYNLYRTVPEVNELKRP